MSKGPRSGSKVRKKNALQKLRGILREQKASAVTTNVNAQLFPVSFSSPSLGIPVTPVQGNAFVFAPPDSQPPSFSFTPTVNPFALPQTQPPLNLFPVQPGDSPPIQNPFQVPTQPVVNPVLTQPNVEMFQPADESDAQSPPVQVQPLTASVTGSNPGGTTPLLPQTPTTFDPNPVIVVPTGSVGVNDSINIPQKPLKFYFMDVGQGNGTLIVCPHGEKILVDLGCSSDSVQDEVTGKKLGIMKDIIRPTVGKFLDEMTGKKLGS